jgi:hypothetical protein
LKAFVIPTSHTTPISARARRVDDLDGQPAGEHDSGGGELGRELHPGAERVEVVREPGEEEERAACEDPPQLRGRLDCIHGDREQHACNEPGEDADAAEERSRAPCQRSSVGSATSRPPTWERRSVQRTRAATGKGRERDDRAHERKA